MSTTTPPLRRETVAFTIPNRWWLTSNMRLHWAAKAKSVAELRRMALTEGRRQGRALAFDRQVRVTAHIGYASNAKADPVNAADTGKALIDGLVAAGIFVDDSHEWVLGPDYRRDETKAPRGFHTVRLEIEEVR